MIVNIKEFKRALIDRNWSLTELSKYSKISQPTLTKIMRRESVMPKTVGKLAKTLNITLERLVEEW